MTASLRLCVFALSCCFPLLAAEPPSPFAADPAQTLERTCFQTSQPWSGLGNLRSDIAIVYGIGPTLPARMQSWRDHGYRIHVMTGVSWGSYQDYLYGRFDGINHEDEVQTDRHGNRHGHGGDVYYMCPGTNYANYLCAGIQHALDSGAEAIHLEEPEFWVQDGYEAAFKREWQSYYGEAWQPLHSSVDAQWRGSKLKYFLYRRALQQVFDYVQEYNRKSGRHVRCYVPTHSLLNYAHWRIVSPESSLARLNGCDGYIAQVWTGTSRTPNLYRGLLKERTFETAFLEYGAMQNLVRSTGRTVWYLNDPIEDNPDHDWNDYRSNWESTMTASLLQPEVWRFEVAPWPERVFGRRYPRRRNPGDRKAMPPAYATEVQTVINALNDLNQKRVEWDCGSTGIGLLVSDSLMFERGDPAPTDGHLSHVYGLALPLLKRGIPLAPVQLENVTIPHYLDGFRILMLSYQGMKPLSATVHQPLANWVRKGGVLVVCDDDSDPFNKVREWWNQDGSSYPTPREHLFERMRLAGKRSDPFKPGELAPVGKGGLLWMRDNPVQLAAGADGDAKVVAAVKRAVVRSGLEWRETSHLLLRRGPYVIAAGLDESISGAPKELRGHFVNLFDADLRVRDNVEVVTGSRFLLFDLDTIRGRQPKVIASACKALVQKQDAHSISMAVEGVVDTPSLVLLSAPAGGPTAITLAGEPLQRFDYSAKDRLLWIRFTNQAAPRELTVRF
jgi:hypothetical protein